MEVWHNILEGIGLSVIILVVVISLLFYNSAPKHAEVIVTRTTLKESLTKSTSRCIIKEKESE